MMRTLRMTAKGWGRNLNDLVFGFLFISFFVYVYFTAPTATGRFVCLILSVAGFIGMVINLLSLLRNKIVLDDQTISGCIDKYRFSLRWEEVIVWDSGSRRRPSLYIEVRGQETTIWLGLFNEKLLRELIRHHVAPEAFRKSEIFVRMPGYHEFWGKRTNERVNDQAADESLRVGTKLVIGIGLGWVCGLLLLLVAVWSWLGGEVKVPLLFLIPAAVGAYLILASGSIEMSKDSITYTTPIGAYRIGWDEVTEVEIDRNGRSLVFIGQNKRLSVFGPAFWLGKDKKRMKRLVMEQVETRGIEVDLTRKAMWRLSKNTKIRSKSQ